MLAVTTACTTAETTAPTEPPPTVTTTDQTSTSASEAPTTSIAALLPGPDELPLPETPAQQEGPYYPVDRLDDQDNDLTVVDGLDGAATGQVLLLSGTLLTTEGEPVAGAVIEIWQTDAAGIYLHPDDSALADRDRFFQGSGTDTVAPDGSWTFRTLNPGYYGSRPRHIHIRVFVDGEPVLTTQVYFSDDPQAAGIDELLVAEVATQGEEATTANHRIVLEG